ncbi:acyltransferase family protein [Microvirga sp. Mcv34]|uniref:acyltransferase family protein n=1 Tax=Microvirga sp. Mcv34 TaxID=2926016 RepID=UPI0021C9688A|nr:acyltransferase [Microvirga sp. Mcv34]
MIRNPAKLAELETVRGVAALVVLVHHSLLGFAPRLEGLFFPAERFGLFGTPLYAIVNGSAAVTLFFVLSGFVLTYRAIGAQNSSGLGLAALKRWPRLAGPVVIVSLASGLLVWAGMYANQPAAEISRSTWLKWWFASYPYSAVPPLAALEEGLLGTFLDGRNYFNSNLWTMYYEFFGSFLVLGLALVIVELKRPRLSILLSAGLFILTLYQARLFAPFIGGVIAAQIYSLHVFHRVRLGGGPALLVAAAAFLLFGFRESIDGSKAFGFYAVLNQVQGMPLATVAVLLHTIGALLLMWLITACAPCKRLFSSRIGLWLGRMSFPIYLTHLLVICTIGSSIFVALKPYLPHAVAVALTISVVFGITLTVSYPLALFDSVWVRFISQGLVRLPGAPLSSPMLPRERSQDARPRARYW